MLNDFVLATNSYADKKKDSHPQAYDSFKKVPLTKEELIRYIAVFLLLSINSVRSYRQAWDPKSSQMLIHLHNLMSHNRFEMISVFFHIVTTEEEESKPDDPLKKVHRMHDALKAACVEYYQPLQELAINERMVKSKARSHFRQYIRNKPTKWGFKYWVLADPTGYTLDFELYCGSHRGAPISEHGLSHHVVTGLIETYHEQGYYLFMDNFYTSPTLMWALKEKDVGSTGTMRTNRQQVPPSVHDLQTAISCSNVPQGVGYYI